MSCVDQLTYDGNVPTSTLLSWEKKFLAIPLQMQRDAVQY